MGGGWTDLRYNLLLSSTSAPDILMTFYHASWMIVAATLLVNLVIGEVVNNYDQIMEDRKQELRRQKK